MQSFRTGSVSWKAAVSLLLVLTLSSCGGGGSDGGGSQPPTTNQPPVAQTDSATTFEGQAVSIAVLSNDSDPEGTALSVTAVAAGNLGQATVNPDRTITFTPADGIGGNVEFEYTISDTAGLTARGTVRLAIGVRRPVLYLASESSPIVREVFFSDGISTVKASAPLAAGENVTEFRTGTTGSFLVYAVNPASGGIKSLHSVALRTPGTATLITPAFDAGSRVTSFVVSPNSSRVAFVVEDGTVTNRLFIATLGGTPSPVQVNTGTQTLDSIQSVRFSPDGSEVFFLLVRRGNQGVINFAIYRAPTSNPASITRVSRQAAPPESVGSFDITPDGRRLVYLGNWAGFPQLVLVDLAATGSDVRLDAAANSVSASVSSPVFTADSATAVYTSFGPGRPQNVYSTTLSAPGSSTLLTNPGDFTSVDTFRLAAGGNLVAYRGIVNAGSAGFGWTRLSAPGVTVERLSDIQFYDVSPDGQVLASGTSSGLLQRFIDPNQQGLLTSDGLLEARHIQFSVDGRYVAYVRTQGLVESVRIASSRPPNGGSWRVLEISRNPIVGGIQQFGFAPAQPY